jgi:hypothetical protein
VLAAERPVKKGPESATPGASATATNAGVPDDQKRASELEVLLKDGKFDEAADGATKLLATTHDDGVKTTASKVLAESLRKKGEWGRASGAYTKLRDCCGKTTDEWYLNDAIAEILRASPNGIYSGTALPAPADPAAKTLSDDGTLKDAEVRLASLRMKALKPRAAAVRAARAPVDVMAALKPLMDEVRRIRTLSDAAAPEVPKELVAAAGARLAEVAAQVVPNLKAKYQVVRLKADRPWSYNNVEKKDILDTHAMCAAMADSEKAFQDCVDTAGDKNTAEDLKKLASASADRQQTYEQLSQQFIVQEYTTIRIL